MLIQTKEKTYYYGWEITMNYNRLGPKKKGMTIREFADFAGISTSLISQIERGQANPSLSVLELIA